MEEVSHKTVQELAFEGEQVPETYFQRDDNDGFLNDAFPLMDIPTIDLGLLLTTSSDAAQELEKLGSALNACGCFQAINHGMTPEFLNEVRQLTKQFFHLPVKEKQKHATQGNDIEGYGNDTDPSQQHKRDWTDRLQITIYPEHQRKLKFWPENPQPFRGILHEFAPKLKTASKVVLKALARLLNLEDNCFLEQYGEEATMFARFNLYPPCPRPDRALGIKPHSDGSAITLLLQDQNVGGLQILKDNQWFRAPVIPEAFLINVGDQLEISSNGMFKSPVHRVVTNSERERFSIAVFCIPESDREIEPIEGLVTESRPRLYKTVKSYGDIYFQDYPPGKGAIDTLKLQI